MSIGHNGGPPLGRNSGWIAIARSMRDHPIVGFHLHARPADANRGAMQPALAFIDLIMECRYEDGFVMNGGRKMAIGRGQLVGAVSWLAARWNWTPMAVRVWLDKLENDGMISRHAPGVSESNKQTGKQATIITLSNYDKFQLREHIEQQAEHQANNKQATSKQQQYKEDKGTKGQRNKEGNPSDLSPSGDDAGKKPTIRIRDVAREAFAEWQEFAKIHGLPVPRNASFEAFAPNIAARLQENADELTRDAMLRVWRIALACVAKSRHCRGENDRGWRADLDFVSNRKSFAKIMAGNYGNGAVPLDDRWRIAVPWATAPPTPPQQPAKSRDGAFRQAIEEWAREGETQ